MNESGDMTQALSFKAAFEQMPPEVFRLADRGLGSAAGAYFAGYILYSTRHVGSVCKGAALYE